MADRDPAELRLWLLTLVRLGGFAIILLGMWLVGKAPGTGGPYGGGLVLMAAGAALSLLGPKYLSRRWK